MAVKEHAERVAGDARPKIGAIASILAQSKVACDAFGPFWGFVLIMSGLATVSVVSLAAIFVAHKGLAVAFGFFAK
jgi:hypothetical protein